MADQPPSSVDAEITASRDLCILEDPEQLELLRDQEKGRDARAAIDVARKRGRGRPPGALNRRNAKFRDQILALAPHPALALARAYSTPLETLAAQLECTKLEAYQVAVRAAAELLPYVESKMPTAVALKQTHDVVLVMPGGSGVSTAELEAIAQDVSDGMAGGIDWGQAEILDVLPDVSREGEPSQDVSREPDE